MNGPVEKPSQERAASDSPKRGTSPRDARRSIRDFAVAWGGLLAALVLTTAAALAMSADLVRRATEAVTRETQALTIATDLEADVVSHRRMAELMAQLRGPTIEASREALGRGLRSQIDQARGLAATPRQRQLVGQVGARLEIYLAADRIEAMAGRDDDVAQGHYVALLGALRDLQIRDVAAARRAHREVVRLTRLSYVGGAVAAVLLLVALAVIGRRLHTALVAPLLELHGAITRFRAGDTSARAAVRGPREVAELTAAFDDMADAISAQRDAQLAFLGGVAHDIRNPLAAMRMAAHLLGRGQEGPSRERTLALLQRQLDRLSRMVEDFLDATRIEAGRLALERRVMDVCAAAREMAQLYGSGAPDHQLVLELPSEPLLVDADPMRIEQVLGNLVSNALKYSPGGGVVLVRARRDAGQVIVEVIDQGIGLARDEIPDLFAPFRRRAPHVGSGAGLGLSVVRRIVLAHGGSIEVESAPNAGSTFRVLLPLAATAPADPDPVDAPGLGRSFPSPA